MSTAYLAKPPASVWEPSVSTRCPRRPKELPHRVIQLFNWKYMGYTHAECVVFVKGVEAVLNYLLKADDAKSAKSSEAHARSEGKPAEPA
jgi:hypothetical protein